MLQYAKDGKVFGWWELYACWSPENSQSFALWFWYQHPSLHLKHSRCISQRTKTKDYEWIAQRQGNFETEFYLKWQQLCKYTLWLCRWLLLAFSVVSHSYTNKNETSHLGPHDFATLLLQCLDPHGTYSTYSAPSFGVQVPYCLVSNMQIISTPSREACTNLIHLDSYINAGISQFKVSHASTMAFQSHQTALWANCTSATANDRSIITLNIEQISLVMGWETNTKETPFTKGVSVFKFVQMFLESRGMNH